MEHPLQLFTKLLAKEKIFPDAEFKEALSLLDESESKQYSEIRDKGLAAIQLTPDEEKALEAILKDNNYPSQNFNFKAYAELLFLTRLGCKKEENQGAELHAVKLALMFSDTQKAVDYLVKFQNSRKKERKQLIHDACLFNPPTGNLNFPLWRTFAIKFMPNKDFERLLPHAEKIQNYVKEKRSDYEKAIWNDLIRKYEVKLSNEYDQKQLTEEDYVKDKMKLSASKIDKDIRKALDTWAKSELKITDKKLNPVQQRQINQFCDEKGQAEKKRLTEEIKTKYQNKFKKEYHTVSPNSLKYDSIKKQLDDLKLLYNKPPDLIAESKSSGMRRILEENFKTSANKIYSEATDLETLLEYAANVSYARSKEKPAAAKLFFSLGLSEESFNKYLGLKPCDDEKQIPNIFIDGEALGYPEFYLKKLSPFDPRAAVLGKLTSCCQSLGNQGEEPAIYGIESPHAGFYVLCRKKSPSPHESERILSQCLAWRGGLGNMVFDSIESQVNFREKYESIIIDFFLYLAHRLTTDYGVTFVFAGTGGQTPDNIGMKIPGGCVEVTKDYHGYSDARKQVVVAIKNILLVKNLAIQNKSTEKYLKNLETKNPDPINYDRKTIRKIMKIIYERNSDSVNKETFVDELLIVGRQLNLTRELLIDELDIILEYGSIYIDNDIREKFKIKLRDIEFSKEYFDQADPDFINELLLIAIKNNKPKLIQFFIKNKLVDINAELDSYECSFLKSAVRNANTDIVKYLVKNSAKIDDKSLFLTAIKNDNVENAKYIKEIQNDVDFSSTDELFLPPLTSAIVRNNINSFQYLLEIKADINKKYQYHGDAEYPLFIAAHEKRKEIVNLILKHPSFIWCEQDNFYFVPRTGNPEIIKLLRDERDKYIPVSQKKIVVEDNLTLDERNKLYANFQKKGKQIIEQESKNHGTVMKKIYEKLNNPYHCVADHHQYFEILLGMDKIDLKIMIQLCERDKDLNFVKNLSYSKYFSENGVKLFEKNYITFYELLDIVLLDCPFTRVFIENGGNLVCDKSINFRVRHFSELSTNDKYDVNDILLSSKGKEILKHDLINVYDFLNIPGKKNRQQFIDTLNIEEKLAERKAKSNASLRDVSIFTEAKQENFLPPETAEQPKQKP